MALLEDLIGFETCKMHKSKKIDSEKNKTKTAKHPKNPKNDTQKK